MFKTLFAAATLLAVTAAPAFASDASARTFTRDGETYTYTTVKQGNHVLITGTRALDGSTFELTVRGDQVSGVSGGVPVSFTMRGAQARLTTTELASR